MAALEFTSQPEFIEDGHIISFVLDHDVVRISHIHCPNVGSTSVCNRRRTYCVVERFIDAYGIDLNIGRVQLEGPIEIAWHAVNGDESDLDIEFDNVWIVPVLDTDYRLMIEDQKTAIEMEGMGTDLPELEAPKEEPPDDDDDIEIS